MTVLLIASGVAQALILCKALVMTARSSIYTAAAIMRAVLSSRAFRLTVAALLICYWSPELAYATAELRDWLLAHGLLWVRPGLHQLLE